MKVLFAFLIRKTNKQTNNHRKSVEFFVIVKNLSSEILNFYFLQKILGASTHFLCFNEKIIELFFVAHILGIYFNFFHIVRGYRILGFMYEKGLLRWENIEVLVSEWERERERLDYLYSNHSLLSVF